MLGMRAVGKVEPCNVHSCPYHSGQSLLVATRRTYGADDFRLSHWYQLLYMKSNYYPF